MGVGVLEDRQKQNCLRREALVSRRIWRVWWALPGLLLGSVLTCLGTSTGGGGRGGDDIPVRGWGEILGVRVGVRSGGGGDRSRGWVTDPGWWGRYPRDGGDIRRGGGDILGMGEISGGGGDIPGMGEISGGGGRYPRGWGRYPEGGWEISQGWGRDSREVGKRPRVVEDRSQGWGRYPGGWGRDPGGGW